MTASGASVQVLTAANLYSSLVGEGEALLRGVFSRAKAASPAIIFLDEIDAIAGSRETQSEEDHSSRQILSSLLTEMDGIEMAEGKVFNLASRLLCSELSVSSFCSLVAHHKIWKYICH